MWTSASEPGYRNGTSIGFRIRPTIINSLSFPNTLVNSECRTAIILTNASFLHGNRLAHVRVALIPLVSLNDLKKHDVHQMDFIIIIIDLDQELHENGLVSA